MISTEFLELAVVVIALYVSELVVYLPPGRAALIVLGKRVRVLRGLGLLSPFPWSRRYDLDDFHLQFGQTSVVAYAPHRIDSRKPLGYAAATSTYEEMVVIDIREKTTVRINAKDFIVAPSASAALRGKRELDEVRNADDKKRPALIRALVERTLDPKVVEAVAKKDKSVLYPLALATTLHSLCVIAVVTFLVFGYVDHWKRLVGALAVTWVYGIFRFYRAHKALRPDARGERRMRTFMYCLSPVGLIKACDFITKERLADVHWLGALRALGTERQSQDALRGVKRELDHPSNRTWISDEPAAKTAQTEFRAVVSGVLEPLVKTETSAKDDEGIVVRCPSCGAAYTKLVAKCFDCGAIIPPPSA